MKGKKIICGAVAAVMTLSIAFSGCDLVTKINDEDMKQTVATVDISKSENLDSDFAQYVSHVGEENIIKRDLVTAFVNVGSSYINNGMSYESAFNALLDELTNNAVVVQYATAYVLKNKVVNGEVTLTEYDAKTEVKDKYEYLLGGEDATLVKKAKYNLYSSLNSALDSYEQTDDEDEKYKGTETRSTPTGIDATEDDYLPLKADGTLDYGVYTGYGEYLLKNAGVYEPVEKSNRSTRRKAYSRFITSVKNNYMFTDDDKDLTDILALSYVQSQYVSQLEQCVIEEFNEIYTKEQEELISSPDENSGVYTFVEKAYNSMKTEQEQTYSKSSTFESAMGSFSDTTFLLYSPDTSKDTNRGTYGYVYNILLPFSTTQSNKLKKLQSYRDNNVIDESGYFAERNALLSEITTTDQRAAWFNGSTDYSFNVKEYNEKNTESAVEYYDAGNADRSYLFFENNLTKTKEYKSLEKYAGLYSYNGKVAENADGSYTLVPKTLNIDDMLAEFSAYINYVLKKDSVNMFAGDKNTGAQYSAFFNTTDFKFDGEDKIDYSKLVYATGKVTLAEPAKENMFVSTSDRYKAMAAVNELQYAYTTDTGVLSQYIGYSVSAYETSYIKEFEYAAQEAIKMGVGAFKVCAGDYGWHLIYVTDTFECEGGAVYTPVFTKARIEEKGTFENKFFEWIKDSTLSNETTQKRTEILQYYSTDSTVKKYTDNYKDLMELD